MRLLRYEIARIYSSQRESTGQASDKSGCPTETLGHTCTHCVQCGVTTEPFHLECSPVVGQKSIREGLRFDTSCMKTAASRLCRALVNSCLLSCRDLGYD